MQKSRMSSTWPFQPSPDSRAFLVRSRISVSRRSSSTSYSMLAYRPVAPHSASLSHTSAGTSLRLPSCVIVTSGISSLASSFWR